jgi:hypothetical protein
MHDSLEIMKIALRVLTAVSQNGVVDPQDIAELEKFGGARPADLALDEFTCGVVQQALKNRAAKRIRAV